MSGYKRVFYDTNPLIYYLEQNTDYCDRMKQFFAERSEEDSDFVTSAITVGEYLTGPYMNQDDKLVADFKDFISTYDFEVATINRDIAEDAAKIRAKYKGFKLMDSLQLAAAKASGCDLFVSNDKQLKQYEDIEVLIVGEMKIPSK